MLKQLRTKFLYYYKTFVFRNYEKSVLLRKLYWDNRADDIQKKYNIHQNDFEVLNGLIEKVKPKRLLEIGAGSGRLLPVYEHFSFIESISLQDISLRALELIQVKDKRVNCFADDILVLDKKIPVQDLIVSNRVLQHIPPHQIAKNIHKICELSNRIYVNELSSSDGVAPTSYMNLHDYPKLFSQEGFEIDQTGRIDSQTFIVFKKRL